MITEAERRAVRERVRRYRAKRKGETYVAPIRACAACNARLSRYAPAEEVLCCACYDARVTLEQYVRDVTRQPDEPPAFCSRGHDLAETRVDLPDRDGRRQFYCRACRRLRS